LAVYYLYEITLPALSPNLCLLFTTASPSSHYGMDGQTCDCRDRVNSHVWWLC